jgi:basic amino acid/polyamine antiporter, APA family
MKEPSKTLPRAIISGILIVIVAYLTVNIAMLHVLPASKIVELGPNAASTGFLPGAKAMSSIHPKYKTPVGATLLQLVIPVIMMLLDNPDRLSDIAIFTVFSFYALSFVFSSILLSSTKPVKTKKATFKSWLKPVKKDKKGQSTIFVLFICIVLTYI